MKYMKTGEMKNPLSRHGGKRENLKKEEDIRNVMETEEDEERLKEDNVVKEH